MRGSFVLRYFRHRDRKSILKIERKMGDGFDVEVLDALIKSVACHIRVATHRGKVVGFMVVRLCQGYAQLLRVAVDAKYRRQGVGTQLVEAACETEALAGHRNRMYAISFTRHPGVVEFFDSLYFYLRDELAGLQFERLIERRFPERSKK